MKANEHQARLVTTRLLRQSATITARYRYVGGAVQTVICHGARDKVKARKNNMLRQKFAPNAAMTSGR